MSQNKNDLTFKYIFNYGYNPTYVNGAQGGISPRGELVVHFYLERPPLPNALSYEISAQGGIGQETGVDPDDLNSSMVRYIDNGVILSYESARNLHYWIGERLKEMEAMEQAKAAMSFPEAGSDVTH